jgi:hypothetical protein
MNVWRSLWIDEHPVRVDGRHISLSLWNDASKYITSVFDPEAYRFVVHRWSSSRWGGLIQETVGSR